ncbi:MAG: hypothetical protein Q8O86_01110 [Dehalococcoidia bacterium]|nr:hypothetical protein [Dehalococcoidia bacterium]
MKLANELGEITRFAASQRLGISTDYAAYLCGWLRTEGYLSPVAGRNAYCLTAKGKEALVSELYGLQGALDKRLEWLSWQRNNVARQIEKLQTEKLLSQQSEVSRR